MSRVFLQYHRKLFSTLAIEELIIDPSSRGLTFVIRNCDLHVKKHSLFEVTHGQLPEKFIMSKHCFVENLVSGPVPLFIPFPSTVHKLPRTVQQHVIRGIDLATDSLCLSLKLAQLLLLPLTDGLNLDLLLPLLDHLRVLIHNSVLDQL